MAKADRHIDLKRLQDYFEGKLTQSERHKLEKEALEDPFLYEAMEGFEKDPSALKKVEKLKRDRRLSDRSFFGAWTLALLAVISAIYLIIIIFFPEDEKATSTPEAYLNENIDSVETVEQEVVPNSIDTLVPISFEEQIHTEEIRENKAKIQDQQSKETAPSLADSINVQDPPEIVIGDPIPEETNKKKVVYAPSTYIEDLYVVDYRRIERKSSKIHYKRFELSGISANYENEDAKLQNELVEKEVEVPYTKYLEGAMYHVSREQYKKALNRFLIILEQYPDDLNALFYGGLSYFNLGEYQKALDFFIKTNKIEQSMRMIAFRQEAKWYLAKTYIQLKDNKAAVEILDEIIAEGLFYSEEAITLKKKIGS